MHTPHQIYSTTHIAPQQRFEYWRDVICDEYLPISCDTPDRSGFEGEIKMNRLTRIAVSRVQGSPQIVRRGKSEIGRSNEAYFMISLQMSGKGVVSQGGRSAVLHPGDFAIYATTEPYEILCDMPVDQLILQLPYEFLLSSLPQAEMLTARKVEAATPLGGMLSRQLQNCTEMVADQSQVVQRHMQDMLIYTVATGLAALSPQAATLSRPEHLLLTRAKAFVRANLRNHDLNRDGVARAMGMSSRNLARAFARDGQAISAYIRQARMEAIAADLADPRFVRFSITELSCKWGITNAQHLSKLFKDSFGQSPRAYRRAQLPIQ